MNWEVEVELRRELSNIYLGIRNDFLSIYQQGWRNEGFTIAIKNRGNKAWKDLKEGEKGVQRKYRRAR